MARDYKFRCHRFEDSAAAAGACSRAANHTGWCWGWFWSSSVRCYLAAPFVELTFCANVRTTRTDLVLGRRVVLVQPGERLRLCDLENRAACRLGGVAELEAWKLKHAWEYERSSEKYRRALWGIVQVPLRTIHEYIPQEQKRGQLAGV